MEQARGESAEMEGAPSGKKRSKRARTAPPVVEEIVTSELATDDVAPESMSEDVPISDGFDAEATVNLVGELPLPGRDDLDEPTVAATSEQIEEVDHLLEQRKHLRGLLEALVFASDAPIATKELAKLASAPQKQVRELLGELQHDFSTRGIHLDEVAGGWVFRTSPQYAPFVRDLTKQKPVRLSRAQIETLAIIAYRQPITRPEIDDVRGVDSGPVMKLLLERDLVRILGKRDEPGRPFIFGTTNTFLEFFGLRSLKDLPTLKEFTELTDESRQEYEEELGEVPDDAAAGLGATQDGEAVREGEGDESLGDDATSDDADASTDDEAAPESGDEHRALRESMRVPISEPEIDDEPHASDQDGPTLTSEAPPPLDDDD
ncbi:MAG: SMC-Scp complex subunit ScpB [Deltaproteobacteria bacterium]|nr:SMC-Scp complex subunit ScpB [Deltaproteobacteria bacterium]